MPYNPTRMKTMKLLKQRVDAMRLTMDSVN